MQQVIRRGFFPYLLQQNADHPAVALVQDPGQRGAHLFLRVGRHALQLTRQALTDQAFQAAAEEIGLQQRLGVLRVGIAQTGGKFVRLFLRAQHGRYLGLDIRANQMQRRSLGAQRSSIVAQFLIESGMLCGMGGIVGIIFGTIGSLALGKILFQMTIFPATWVTLAAFGLSVALGVLFGSYPAAKASKLQPVEALRAD